MTEKQKTKVDQWGSTLACVDTVTCPYCGSMVDVWENLNHSEYVITGRCSCGGLAIQYPKYIPSSNNQLTVVQMLDWRKERGADNAGEEDND